MIRIPRRRVTQVEALIYPISYKSSKKAPTNYQAKNYIDLKKKEQKMQKEKLMQEEPSVDSIHLLRAPLETQ